MAGMTPLTPAAPLDDARTETVFVPQTQATSSTQTDFRIVRSIVLVHSSVAIATEDEETRSAFTEEGA